MTRDDAELLLSWLIATYGDPSERSIAVTFVSRNDYYKGDGDADRNRNGRMRRDENRNHDESNDRPERRNPHQRGND